MVLRRNVLIFHSGALGDFVLTWPIALAAARLHAQSRTIYVTHGQKGALAEKLLRVDSTDIEEGWHELFSSTPKLPERVMKLLSGAHTILSFLSSGDDQWATNIRALAPGAQLLCVTVNAAAPASAHVTEQVVDQLKPIPALHAAAVQMLRWVTTNGILSASPPTDGFILIHPGSGAARKCWLIGRFIELAERLKHDGRSVRFALGEVEREQWPREQIDRLQAVGTIERPQSYLQLYEQIRQASQFIGNDTGPSHLAAISGLRTVAIFANDPIQWQPIGPRIVIVQGQSMEAISVDEVVAAATRPFAS